MNYELAEQVVILAAPIYAALIVKTAVALVETEDWQREARAAALRQAHALWLEALEHEV